MHRALAPILALLVACSDSAPTTEERATERSAASLESAREALQEYEFTRDPARLERAVGLAEEALRVAELAGVGRLEASAWLGRCLQLSDRFAEARSVVEDALRARESDGAGSDLGRSPSAAMALIVLGESCLALGELETARAALERAVQLEPQGAAAQHLLGQCLEQLGDDRAAHDAYAAALALEPTRAATYLRLSSVLERSDDPASSAAALDEFYRWSAVEAEREHALQNVAEAPEDADALASVARAELELGRFDDARAWARRALRFDAECFEAELVAGLAASASDDAAAARAHFVRASEIDEGDGRPRLELAFLAARRGDGDAARVALEAARQRGVAAFDRGLVLLELGDDLGALLRFDEHIAGAPRHVEARLAAAQVLVGQERFKEAAARYGEVLELEPGHEGARGSLRYVERLMEAEEAR